MNISFGLSLTFLNIANTLASSMDFLATAENYKIHRFVYTALYFSVGMLAYTIPVQVYSTYVLHYQEGERNLFHGLVMLIATLTGAGLIVMLMNFEKAILGEEKAKLEEQYAILERIVDDLARDIQGKMGEQLKNKNMEKLMDAVEDDKALLDEVGSLLTQGHRQICNERANVNCSQDVHETPPAKGYGPRHGWSLAGAVLLTRRLSVWKSFWLSTTMTHSLNFTKALSMQVWKSVR